MAHIENCATLRSRDIVHLVQTLFLKCHITYRQHFIHNHYLGVQMCSNRKRKFHVHTAGIPLHRRIDKLSAFGEFDDILQLLIDLFFSHPQNRAVHIDILPAGQLRMKSRADLQHGRNPSVQADHSAAWHSNSGDQFKQSGLSCTISPDNPDPLSGLQLKGHIIQRQKSVASLILLRAYLLCRIFPVTDSGT